MSDFNEKLNFKKDLIENYILDDMNYNDCSYSTVLDAMGYSVKAAQTEMEMVAEGYYGTKAIWLANQDVQVDLPIVEAVYQILYNRRSAKAVIKELTKKFQ